MRRPLPGSSRRCTCPVRRLLALRYVVTRWSTRACRSCRWPGRRIPSTTARLYRPTATGENIHKVELRRTAGKKRTSVEQKIAVANYFVAEMFLGAEMCLDRNYVAMHKLDALFSYEVLVTMLKLDITSNVKAAAVRLLMCLYVDRDPQAVSKIPCLTRTWTDIKRDAEPRLPYVEPARHAVCLWTHSADHLRACTSDGRRQPLGRAQPAHAGDAQNAV